MNAQKEKIIALCFWVTEAALLSAACFCEFVMVGYMAFAILLLAAAVFLGLYRLIAKYANKNPRSAKTLKVTLISLACLGVVCLIAIEIPIIMAAHTDKDPKAPYLIVLGAEVVGVQPSYTLHDRLEAAKEYLDDYPQTIAVVSGGQGKDEEISEAECMRNWLVENGIAADRILMEMKSTSTEENIMFSLEAINENGGDPTGRVAVCSSEYHLYRAKYYAVKMGATPLGVAARSTMRVQMLSFFVREAFGIARMNIM